MNFTQIQDLTEPSILIYKQLRENHFTKDNSFIADSPKVVNMLLKTDIEIKSILATKEYYEEHKKLIMHKKIPQLFIADKELLQNIVGHKIHHNVMMHGIRPKEHTLDELDENIIMLDALTSNENIGSIARSAAALGVNSYMLSKSSPHPYSRRALRVSMGHVSMLKIHIYSDIFTTLKSLKQRGYKIFAAEVTSTSTPLQKIEVPKKWVLLMGHESKGISKEIIEFCDECVQIEMQQNIKSFNVSVASAILMYQFRNS